MSNILGISAGYHDAAISVVSGNGDILFAAHSERYSKKKNDPSLCPELFESINVPTIDAIAYYENPRRKQMRQLYAGQEVDWSGLFPQSYVRNLLDDVGIDSPAPILICDHHRSHAAAGFQTSPFRRATVVIIDAVGEWDTVSIWGAEYGNDGKAKYTRLWGQRYPHSLGLFYSAMTQRVGLHPLDEEYILMGMAAYGKPSAVQEINHRLISDAHSVRFKENLHAGVGMDFLKEFSDVDIAASAQAVLETLLSEVMGRAVNYRWSNNLVYMGGVALNCLANRSLGDLFDRIWIMPAPGDAGSSLGAAALSYGFPLHWRDAYLGHDIGGRYPVNDAMFELHTSKIVGVASGRAEFGPRALGNRSLLADPRGEDVKARVNCIKLRQHFRPFAPVIMEEFVNDYFDMPTGFIDTGYMQVVGYCKRPDLFPAIVHVDGTSRVQTVSRNSGSGIRKLLEEWYVTTGCPMLLNTSLNIRGMPMVNDLEDARKFEELYGIKVCS